MLAAAAPFFADFLAAFFCEAFLAGMVLFSPKAV